MLGGSGREFFATVTSRPRDFSVELKMLLEWPFCFNVLDSNVLFTERQLSLLKQRIERISFKKYSTV